MKTFGFYTSKGGQGCTITAATFALSLGRPVALIDVSAGGDVFAAYGAPEQPPGTPHQVSELVEARKEGRVSVATLTGLLAGIYRRSDIDAVVIDYGTCTDALALALADRTILVTRACYLALRHAVHAHLPSPHAVALILEPGRALTARDVARVVGVTDDRVVTIGYSPETARAVDAGLLSTNLRHGRAEPYRHIAAVTETVGCDA